MISRIFGALVEPTPVAVEADADSLAIEGNLTDWIHDSHEDDDVDDHDDDDENDAITMMYDVAKLMKMQIVNDEDDR
ncbi:hypothetical protein Tco_0451257 [Tanacetum coccineum]